MESIGRYKKYIFLGISVILLIVLISVISVYLYKTSPSYKVKTTLKTELNYLKNEVSKLNASTYNYLMKSKQLEKNKNSTYVKKPLTVTTDLDFNLSLTKNLDKSQNQKLSIVENLLNNSDTTITTNLDLDNNYIDGKVNYKHDSGKVNASYYITNNEVYLYIKDFLDKYVVLVDENSDELQEITHMLSSGLSYSDVNVMLAIVSNTIDEVKISDKIVSSKESVKIGNVSKETKKDALNIDNELIQIFSLKLIENIVNSESALNIANKIEGSENINDTKDKLVSLYNQIKSGNVKFLKEDQSIKMNIYMQGFLPEFLMQEVEYNINENLNGKVSFLKYNVDNYTDHFILETDKYNIALNSFKTSDEENNIQIVFDKDNNKSYTFELSGFLTAKKIDAKYNLKSSTQTMCEGKLSYYQNFDKSQKDASFSFEYDAQNINYGKGTLEAKFSIKNTNSVKKQEINNKITLEELSENDIGVIKSKILKKLPTLYNLIK